MNVYQEHALKLLNKLVKPTDKPRTQRGKLLLCRLKPLIAYQNISAEEFCHGWAFHVGTCFSDDLDCKLQQRVKDKQKYWLWTQGNVFAFKTGSIFYDVPVARHEPWSDTLQKMSYCLAITGAFACSPQKTETPRGSGIVRFQAYTPNSERTALQSHGDIETVTQEEFVRLLIQGLPEKWR